MTLGPIDARLQQAVSDFRQQHGRAPSRILLGASEHTALLLELSAELHGGFALPRTFMGVPIIVSDAGGVRVE